MPKTLTPRPPARGFAFDICIGDRLYPLGDGSAEVVRGDRLIGLIATDCEAFGALRLAKAGDEGEGESKKDPSKIPPGSKWITVNPHDVPGDGRPLLVKPHEDGSASVLGGAGGKLNMLKLTNLKSPEQWRDKAKKKKDEEKQRRAELDDESREAEDKATQKIKEFTQTAQHENALGTLAALDSYGIDHGLTAEHKRALQSPPDPGAESDAVEEWQRLAKEATQKIKAIHQAYEHKLVTDHNARAAAKMGDLEANIPTENRPHQACAPDGNELSTMQQLPNGEWLVKSDSGSKTFKSWSDAAKEHLRGVMLAEQNLGGIRSQADDFYSPSKWVGEPKSEQLPQGFEFKPEAAMAIAQLSAERKAADKAAKEGLEAVKKRNPLEVMNGLTARVQEITQQEVIAKLETEAKTLQDAFINDSFLNLIQDVGEAEKIQRHSQSGGWAKLAEINSEVLKQTSISRALVDELGHNEAAKVLAYQMKQALSDREYEQVMQAQAAHHAQISANIAKGTVKRVQPMMDKLKSIHEEMLMLSELSDGELSPEQQIQMDTLAYDARTLNDSVQEILGTTLGQLQASAAMTMALESGAKTLQFTGDRADKVASKLPETYSQSDLDGTEEVKPPSVFEAYGLTGEDYRLMDGPDGGVVQINEQGMKKLAVGYSAEDKEAYERAVAIKRGDFDEEGFSPEGFSYYAKASFSNGNTEALQFDTKFDVLGKLAAQEGASQSTLSLFGDPEPAAEPVADQEIEDGLRGYIGGRVANGENPLDVMNDVRSPEFYLQQGLDPYGASALKVQNIASDLVKRAAGGDGSRISDKSVVSAFQAMADDEAAKQRRARQTDDLQTLHAQTLDSDTAIEAAHRSLAAMPMARTVFKQWSDLTAQEKRKIKEYAITEVLGEALEAPKPKQQASAIPDEVAEEQFDIFGNKISAQEALGGEESQEELTQWQKFSKLMGGDEKAIAAARDHFRGKFMHRFANAYAAISGQSPLIGGERISHVDKLMLAKLPEDQRNAMLDFMRTRDASDVAKVRSRVGGKFSAEMDDDWLAKYEEIKGDNRQISLLSADTGRSQPKTDFQRTTLGNAAEAQLHELMAKVVPNFDQISAPSVAIIPEVNWGAGTQHVMKQRVLKMLEAQKKIGLHAGAGSGKSATMLGAFSHLHAQGKVKKMVVGVPSSIVGQFIGEAATFLEPGKYNYAANLGWDREQRLAALKDPNMHVFVSTRESLTNDLLHLVEKHTGTDSEAYRVMPEDQQRELMLRACKAEGIDPENMLMCIDEAHDISARKGVDPSKRSIALKTLGHHSGYYMEATGDPQKNDPSEFYSFLHAVAPDKFNDLNKFMAEYGQNTEASKRSFQRVIAPYTFAFATKPQDKSGQTLKMNEYQPKIQISEKMAAERQRIMDDVGAIAKWQKKRRAELKEANGPGYQPTTEDFNTAWEDPEVRAAVDRLGAADTWGAMTEGDRQAAIGGQIRAMGALKRTALWRLIHLTPYEDNPKMQWTVEHAIKERTESGKPGIIFSSSSKACEMMVEQFEKRGLKVAYIHGGLDGSGKDAERIKFQDSGEADILIATDAARTGVNLTRGKFVTHYDVPLTEMSYAQRSARSYRLKQSEDVSTYVPMLDMPEERQAFARMERKGREAKVTKTRSERIDDTGLARKIRERQQMLPKAA